MKWRLKQIMQFVYNLLNISCKCYYWSRILGCCVPEYFVVSIGVYELQLMQLVVDVRLLRS